MAFSVSVRRMGFGVVSDPTDLYRYFDDEGKLLYVGISFSAIVRASQHKANADWFDFVSQMTVERFESRDDASKAEIEAIRSENPIYNKTFSKLKSGKKCLSCEKRKPEEEGMWEDEMWICFDCWNIQADKDMQEYWSSNYDPDFDPEYEGEP